MIGKLIVAGVVLVGAGGVGDVGVRSFAETQMENRVSATVPQAKGTSAHITSFPFVGRLFVSGKAGTIRIHLDSAKEGLIAAGPVDLTLHDVRVDKDQLRKRHLVLTSIGSGEAALEITDDTLSAFFKVPIRISGSGAEVTVAGAAVPADVRLTGTGMTVSAAGVPVLTVPLPDGVVLPCEPQSELLAGRVRLTCTFTEIPVQLQAPVARGS